MKRSILAACAAVTLPASLLMPATAAHASTTRCDPNSSNYAGACYTMSTFVKKSLIVEAVPVQNTSKITVTAHCDFKRTITESFKASVAVTASAKATVFDAVEVGVSATVSLSVTQTGSQATSVGGSFKLKPGQSLTCERIYSLVTTNVTEHDYTGTKQTTKKYTVTIPSTLGVRFA